MRSKIDRTPLALCSTFDPEAKLLRRIGVEPAIFDIGANTGIYSALLEDLVGPQNVYLFEPLPHLHKLLKRKFKRSHVFNCAVSDREGEQIMRIPYIKGHRLDTRASLNAHAERDQTGCDEVTIVSSCLDTIVERIRPPSIGLIKMDVEGHELELLRGARHTLHRYKPLVLIEIEVRHHEFPIETIFAEFDEMHYKGFYVDPATCALLSIGGFCASRDQREEDLKTRNFMRYLNNFFFVHEDSEAAFCAKVAAFLEAEKDHQV